jgi:ParB-like chromosome segregation protein Spo0J
LTSRWRRCWVPEFGFVQPVLARSKDKMVVGGHQRLVAGRRLGYETVPVVFLDITLEQARLLNLGFNKISGDWDQELLARLLADLRPVEGLDLALSGFEDDEVAKLLKSLETREKRDRVEHFDLDATRAAPRAQRGEIWALATIACSAATLATQPT